MSVLAANHCRGSFVVGFSLYWLHLRLRDLTKRNAVQDQRPVLPGGHVFAEGVDPLQKPFVRRRLAWIGIDVMFDLHLQLTVRPSTYSTGVPN